VYWGGPFAQTPLQAFTRNGLGGLGEQLFHQIYIDGKLDNVETHIFIDSRLPRSFIYRPQAALMFGWRGVPEGAKKIEPLKLHGYKDGDDTYSFPFKTLNLGGLVINNPQIALWDAPGPGVANNVVFIGMDVLRLLHLYVAYDKSMLYISPATPPSPPAQPVAPAAN